MKYIYIIILSSAITFFDKKQVTQFVIPRSSIYTKLPDSLGGTKTHGLSVIELSIAHNLKITYVRLLKLKLQGVKTVDYSYPTNLSKNEKRFLPFLTEYAKKQKIKRAGYTNSNSKDGGRVSILVRF